MNILKENLILIIIGIVSLLVVAVAVLTTSAGQLPSGVSNQDLVKENSQVLGSRDAKVTIVEFSDFQCPACRAAHSIVKEVTAEYGDRILFVYRHFPIVSSHPNALGAAEAAEAAGEQGKYWGYHDILFENQENLKKEDLQKYAKKLGLDMDKFGEALDTGKFKDKVRADIDDAQKLGVRATPTFFINGERYQGVIELDKFKSLIDRELAK
ncbi:MAG TPA: thioredoxin domain-containing protein [Candidatus Nanoarchaeia archaeon]